MDDLEKRKSAERRRPPLPDIFVGQELQKKLKVKLGDRLRVVAPKADLDPSSFSSSPGLGDAPRCASSDLPPSFTPASTSTTVGLAYVELKEAQPSLAVVTW